MTIALIIIGSLMAYAFIGGYAGSQIRQGSIAKCTRCDPPYRCGKHNSWGDGPVWAGLAWPFALPMVAGARVADSASRESRRALKHERRMKELEAERRLAEARESEAAAAMQYLVDNGIKADPSMFEETHQK